MLSKMSQTQRDKCCLFSSVEAERNGPGSRLVNTRDCESVGAIWMCGNSTLNPINMYPTNI
jgi:hypothetical protein